MKSDNYNRYLWILYTLVQYKRLSFDELNYKWINSYISGGNPLNKRTFHKYKKAIEDMFGVNILCENCGSYMYYIEDTALLENDRLHKWMLNSFSVENLVHEGHWLKDRILLEEIPEGFVFLENVIRAIKDCSVIRIHYKPFYDEAVSVYHVSPYCMKLHHQRWYVLGFFRELGGIRHFALDRTEDLEITEEKFEYPSDFSPQEYYKNSIGIWTDSSKVPERIILRAYGQQAKYFRTLPFHHSQKEICTADEYSDFEYKLCITTDLVMELLSKGSRIEVIEPESLRAEMRTNLIRMFNRYNK